MKSKIVNISFACYYNRWWCAMDKSNTKSCV